VVAERRQPSAAHRWADPASAGEDYDRVNLLFPPRTAHSTLAQREAARSALLASATAAAEAVSEVCGARGPAREVWTTAANLAFTLSLVADDSDNGADAP
jgi:hypothetical protein